MRIFLFGSGERALVENRHLIPNPLSVFGMGEGGFRKTVPFTVRYKFIVEREELCSGFRVEYKFLKASMFWQSAYSGFHLLSLSSIEYRYFFIYAFAIFGVFGCAFEVI